MDLFIVEVEFHKGKNKGQVWKYPNLNIIQVCKLHEKFPIQIIYESRIFVKVNYEPSKRISIEEFIFHFNIYESLLDSI